MNSNKEAVEDKFQKNIILECSVILEKHRNVRYARDTVLATHLILATVVARCHSYFAVDKAHWQNVNQVSS